MKRNNFRVLNRVQNSGDEESKLKKRINIENKDISGVDKGLRERIEVH